MKDKLKHIGKKVEVVLATDIATGAGLRIPCEVTDYKNTYGKERWKVEPISGSGFAWMELAEDSFY